jgi:hypothetical protein
MMSDIRTACVVAAAAGLAAPLAAVAGPIEVIYTKKAGDPKAAVAGAVGLDGSPEAVEWKAMEDLVVSPDGSRWMIRARTTAAADHDTGIVSGTGTAGTMMSVSTASGPFIMQEGRPAPFGNAVIMQEGRPAPFGNAADWIDFFPSGFGRFDDNNRLVFGIRARTTQTGATTAADANRVLRWDGTVSTLAFKQGDLYTGLQDLAPAPSGDEAVGNSVGSYHLLNDGRVGSQDSTITSLHSSRRPAITYDRTGFHQREVTTVLPGPFGPSPLLWATLGANEFYTTPDGLHHVIGGTVMGGTTADDGVLAYDGTVVLREGSAIPGTSVLMGDFFQTVLAGSGDWISRGRDNSGTSSAAPDWAVRNGVLVAKTGDATTPTLTERWGDTFLAVTTNRVGDWIVVGNTDNQDAGADTIVVLNGTDVVLREGDPVDLNGNGVFDDDAFIGRGVNTNAALNANTWYLTDDRMLYGIVMLRNAAGQDLTSNPVFGTPQAFIRIDLGGPAPCYANCDASTVAPILNVSDFICFQTKFAAGDSYANCDGSTVPPVLNVSDFICFQTQFAQGCP